MVSQFRLSDGDTGELCWFLGVMFLGHCPTLRAENWGQLVDTDKKPVIGYSLLVIGV